MPTLQELQDRRQRYIDAETRILKTQEYTVGQGMNARRSRRAELESVQAAIRELDVQIDALQQAGARRLYRVVPGCR